MPLPDWTEVYAAVGSTSRTDHTIDVLFNTIDDMLIDGEFDSCDAGLETLDLERLDTNLLIAALSITKSAAPILPSRQRFVERVEQRVRELAPERLEELMSGIR